MSNDKDSDKGKYEVVCGSETMVGGVCTICGAKPRVNPDWFSKKEWEKIKHKCTSSPSKEDSSNSI